MGRLVQNHSTNIEGLIKWLKKIAASKEVKTVTPASLSKTNGRGEKLELKVTVKTNEGYKLLARKGSCLLYTSPSPRDRTRSRMPSSA